MTKVLKINASARSYASVTRQMVETVIADMPDAQVTTRDVTDPIPFVTEDWIAAAFSAPDDRTDAMRADLAVSDALVAEVQAADVLVIGTPIYNFGVPASLKAWFDQVARAGVTFKYTETGPKGLLEGKSAIIVIAAGGTPIGSEIDFASRWLTHVLGFIGITDVRIVTQDSLKSAA